MEALVYKDKKMLRRGYTTGTCAALAAQGAVSFLVSGIWPETAEFMTPAGQMVRVPLMEKKAGNGAASCAVKKDAGDDPDVTGWAFCLCPGQVPAGKHRECPGDH